MRKHMLFLFLALLSVFTLVDAADFSSSKNTAIFYLFDGDESTHANSGSKELLGQAIISIIDQRDNIVDMAYLSPGDEYITFDTSGLKAGEYKAFLTSTGYTPRLLYFDVIDADTSYTFYNGMNKKGSNPEHTYEGHLVVTPYECSNSRCTVAKDVLVRLHKSNGMLLDKAKAHGRPVTFGYLEPGKYYIKTITEYDDQPEIRKEIALTVLDQSYQEISVVAN